MYPDINLLPWREDKRKTRRKRLLILLIVTVILSGGVTGSAVIYFKHQLTVQTERVTRLTDYLVVLDRQHSGYQSAMQHRERLRTQLAVFKSKHDQKDTNTFVMNLMQEVIPEGIYLETLSREENRVEISGYSQSSEKLEQMLGKLRNTSLIGDSHFNSINSGLVSGEQVLSEQFFNLTFLIRRLETEGVQDAPQS